MKTTTQQKSQSQTKFFLTSLGFLSITLSVMSCSKSRSTDINAGAVTNFSSSAIKILADCQKTKTTDISMSSSDVKDQNGVVDGNWLKIKFNFISQALMKPGNTIRFFRWKVSGTQSMLDQTPLVSMFYGLNTNQIVSQNFNSIPVEYINSNTGIYIMLNDSQAQYQVLKTVIYDSSGKITSQFDSLIPQFSARPVDYAQNNDGSLRSDLLKNLHPLSTTDTSAWSANQFTQYFQAACF